MFTSLIIQPLFRAMLHLTGHTLVESTLFQCHFNEITWNQGEMAVELTSLPSCLENSAYI